ncbi:hypothetical protein PUN28_013343 [Cardiocondyla obscurior]|uniref:Transmembrane protein 234 n=1 Tax=Cardiocondyla obscurior TaxID=286306 RepID=A0AAW2FCZ8_9HYME
MAVTVDSVIYLFLVAILWGTTNPFMRKGARGLEDVKGASFYEQFFKEIAFLVTKLNYILPFLVNQCGSILYFLTLESTDLSLAVPVSNSLSFVFTAITSWFLGEEKVHKNTYLGMILVLCGTTLCCWDKLNKTVEA